MRQLVALALLVNASLAAAAVSAVRAAAAEPIRIVAFGDSLTAGYGLAPSKAFPVQLAKALEAKGRKVEISNAGVSGDTSGAALQRIDWAVPDGVDAVIVEFGGNDALRGIKPAKTRQNLEKIIAKLKARNIEVLFAGMVAPRNWGNDYEGEFNAVFEDIAKANDVVYYPFFLDGVAMDAKLNLDDGIHPSAKGVGVIVDRIMPKVEELIGRVEAKRQAASKS